MNHTVITVTASFLKSNSIDVSWQELLWGISKQYISPIEITRYALDRLEGNSSNDDDLLVALCGLTKDELYKVRELTEKMARQEIPEDEKEITDKWLYIILYWIYDNKEQFADPLGVVEMIYADFNYPESISSFVRYMPSDEVTSSHQENVDRLMKNWEIFVKGAGKVQK